MFTYEHYKDIFRLIDDALYDQIAYRGKCGGATSIESRVKRINLEKERAQKIIAAYMDERAAMIQKIILDDRFARIPMPDQPTHQEPMNADPLLQRLISAANELTDELIPETDAPQGRGRTPVRFGQ